MSKTKQGNIGKFELLYIVSNKFSEDEVNEIKPKIDEIITKNTGKIIKTQDWGKRRLAYPIKKFSFGYYILVIFEVDRKKIASINTLMNQMREILRFSIVKYIKPYEIKVGLPEPPNTNAKKEFRRPDNSQEVEIKRKSENAAEIKIATESKTKTEEDSQKNKKAEPKKIKSTENKEKELKEEKTKKDKETTKKEDDNLDEKLDNILEAKDLF